MTTKIKSKLADDFTFKALKEHTRNSLSVAMAYLDKFVKDISAMNLEEIDKKSDLQKQRFNDLHLTVASYLDITHRSYPYVYNLFKKDHKQLDNIYTMFKRFEAAKLLKKCECKYCNDNPLKVDINKPIKKTETVN